ncbi:hypothetical protein MUS1_06635 [Marinomonas ushuaiensis DSM 15871]|uniref:Uncharacterized protein n=1 Tax=Marinomonas ushuaiensis DSM 15871 TaxID=1122207 RepID=X7E352_9GAMM|nr:hypothetical protein [Marinomonas ushuaiensis]ETX09596.1 hypothetical protein MUS1_06635 [Marinomonas ushuaiensis DSM 15871]
MVYLIDLKQKITAGVAIFILSSGSISQVQAEDSNTIGSNIVGSAYSLKTGSLLYRETYKEISDVLHEVEYAEPDGNVFGRKTIDFSQSRVAPSFTQINERNGEDIQVTQEGGDFVVSYKGNTAFKQKTERLKVDAGMVIDAGFDGFIKQYWSVLESGKKLDVDYLVPSEQDTFGFRVSRTACIDGTKNDAMCFSLSPISWVVKLAVDPIVVAYDTVEKKLLRFTGRGNIANTKGKYESVDIQYRYF